MNEPSRETPEAPAESEREELTPLIIEIIEPTIRIPSESAGGGPVWWIEPSNPEIDPSAEPPPEGEP